MNSHLKSRFKKYYPYTEEKYKYEIKQHYSETIFYWAIIGCGLPVPRTTGGGRETKIKEEEKEERQKTIRTEWGGREKRKEFNREEKEERKKSRTAE